MGVCIREGDPITPENPLRVEIYLGFGKNTSGRSDEDSWMGEENVDWKEARKNGRNRYIIEKGGNRECVSVKTKLFKVRQWMRGIDH